MKGICRKVLYDEQGQPIAVQISIADWKKIERRLSELPQDNADQTSLEKLFGSVPDLPDGMEFQREARGD